MGAVIDLDGLFKAVEILAVVGSAGAVMYKLGRTTEKFEQIGKQQASEITELKTDIKEMTKVIADLAKNSARLDRFEERQLAQGKRLDELSVRFNRVADDKSYIP